MGELEYNNNAQGVSQCVREIYFSNPQMDVMETTAQRVLMQCGVGSGKSHVIGMVAFDFVANNPEVRGFIGANTYSQLSGATLDRVFKVWEEVYGLRKNTDYVVDRIPPNNFHVIGPPLKSYENTISFRNGALIFVASLENYRAIDGKEFGWAMLDETKDTREEAVKDVIIARLRQIGMMIDSKGRFYYSRKYNPETKEVEDVAAKKVKEGIWTHDVKENKYYITKTGEELKGYNPLYIFTSPAKARWISDWFDLDSEAESIERCIYSETDYYRKKRGDKLVVISSTYHNKMNLSPGYIDRLIEGYGGDKNRIKMYIYGSPFGKAGGEFYHKYDRLKHVKQFGAWADEPLHISFDFNSAPYMTATIWQMKMQENGRYLVREIDEICLPNPRANTPELCREIIKRYGPEGFNLLKMGSFYYYGDYSGKNSNTLSDEYRHHYEVIEVFFAKWISNTSNRLIPNALHARRNTFMNSIFMGAQPLDVEINNICKNTKGDFEFVKEDANGSKLKTKVTKEGISFEEYGHCSDTADYFFCGAFNNLFNLHIQNNQP